MTATRPVRWGFLGAGFIATHALGPAVHAADGAVLQVVGARESGRASALQPARATTSYAEVCTSDDVDAVYVALANGDHLPWVLTALAAGKHVLCEKPLGLDAEEVAVMAGAARNADRLLVEAAWNRWHPRTQRLADLVATMDGPRTAQAWFTFPSVPAGNYRLDPVRGGGALLDVGCYAVSGALMALASDQVEVRHVERHEGPTGVDLTTAAWLATTQGTARVLASFERPESQGLTVRAPGLTVELLGEAFTTWHRPCSLRVVRDGVQTTEDFPACDAYRLMVQAVSSRIRGGDDWVLPLSASLAVAGALDAVAAASAR